MVNVLSAGPRSAAVRHPLPPMVRIGFMVLLLLQELDLITSIVSQRGVVEDNVLIAAVLAAGGGFAFLLVKAVGSVIVYFSLTQLARLSLVAAYVVLIASGALMASVVIGNLRIMLG